MNAQIYTFEENNRRIESSWINSGLFLASDPFNYTINATSGIIISGVSPANEDVLAFDSLSDEIGITHEMVEGEIVAGDED
jgi:hypothetical protein